MTSVGRGFAAQHGCGRILAGVSKEPDHRGDGRIDFFPGTLLGLYMVCCNQKITKLRVESGGWGEEKAPSKGRAGNFKPLFFYFALCHCFSFSPS